jgi:GT2 family glycosyltransferase
MPCFNAIEYTKQAIKSVLINTNVNYELILINNGSQDGTKEYFDYLKNKLKAKGFLKKITILQFEQNLGVAKSLNLGISKSVGKYVCYLNSDTIVTKNWLLKMVRRFKIDKKVSVVGTMFNKFEDKNFVKQVQKNKSVVDKIAIYVNILNKDKTKKADMVHGLCMLMKKNIFKEIGMFDEKFYPCFGEDLEFIERLKKHKYKMVDAMDVFIFHYWNQSSITKYFNKQYGSIKKIRQKQYELFSIPKKYKI